MLEPGAQVHLEGAFDGDESAGGVLAVVCKAANGARRYHVRVLEVQDDYLKWHLLESGLFGSTVLFRLATDTAEDSEETFQGELQELAISWRTVVAAGCRDWDALGTVEWLSKKDAERLPKDVKFCREMMVAAAVSLGTAASPAGCPLLGTSTFGDFGESRVGSVCSVWLRLLFFVVCF